LGEEDITDNVILLKIKKYYREGMSPRELYDVTRGYWIVAPENAEQCRQRKTIFKLKGGCV